MLKEKKMTKITLYFKKLLKRLKWIKKIVAEWKITLKQSHDDIYEKVARWKMEWIEALWNLRWKWKRCDEIIYVKNLMKSTQHKIKHYKKDIKRDRMKAGKCKRCENIQTVQNKTQDATSQFKPPSNVWYLCLLCLF